MLILIAITRFVRHVSTNCYLQYVHIDASLSRPNPHEEFIETEDLETISARTRADGVQEVRKKSTLKKTCVRGKKIKYCDVWTYDEIFFFLEKVG